MKKQSQDMKMLSNQMQQEIQRMKSEVAPAAQVSKLVQKEVKKLSSEVGKNVGDFGSMKMVVASTTREVQAFKKEIYDSGVLNPKIELEDHHEERPPVGTIELGEDIFSARLLVKLGFVKARQDLADQKEEDGVLLDEDDSEDPRNLMVADQSPHFSDLVSGIALPAVPEQGCGYYKVTVGWLVVCLLTMGTQLLIVGVIIRASVRDADACFTGDLDVADRMNLRLSKVTGVIVAGTIMGRELMDTVNYGMIGELLESGRGLETLASLLIRCTTIVLIALANVLTFMNAHTAADVFMNMTSLSFIGDLGYFGLDVAKRGVLGHHIMKTMTGLNFTISLVSVYPWWFQSVHNSAVIFTSAFILVSSLILLFVMEVPVCNEDGSSPGSAFTAFLAWFGLHPGEDGVME